MSKPYVVKCLDAKFDDANGMLVLNCLFEQQQTKKVIVLSKEDFNYRGHPVPDREMKKTAAMFPGKRFKLVVDDDPERTKLSVEQQQQYAAMFNERITSELEKVKEGLADESQQIQRKIGKLLEDKSVAEIIAKEKAIQAKISGIGQ